MRGIYRIGVGACTTWNLFDGSRPRADRVYSLQFYEKYDYDKSGETKEITIYHSKSQMLLVSSYTVNAMWAATATRFPSARKPMETS